MRVPVVLVEDREGDAWVPPEMAEPGAGLVHVQEDQPVDPGVPRRHGVGRAVGPDRRDDGWMRLGQEGLEVARDGCRSDPASLRGDVPRRPRVPVPPQAGVGLPERHRELVVVRLLGREVAVRGGDELLLRRARLDASRPRVEPLAKLGQVPADVLGDAEVDEREPLRLAALDLLQRAGTSPRRRSRAAGSAAGRSGAAGSGRPRRRRRRASRRRSNRRGGRRVPATGSTRARAPACR